MRIADATLLEPKFRRALEAVLDELHAKQIPLQIYETVRSPSRQNELYARGRDENAADYGRTVTNAKAYQSAHQYGLAADLVFFVDGKWSWEAPPRMKAAWSVYHMIAEGHGLKPLSFEKPHVQIKSFDWHDLDVGPNDLNGWLEYLRARNGVGIS